jgi:hypothetical protein
MPDDKPLVLPVNEQGMAYADAVTNRDREQRKAKVQETWQAVKKQPGIVDDFAEAIRKF